MGMIPRRLVRTVPAATTEQVERWWATACALHPDWEHVTHRDPIDPALFPFTSDDWPRCTTGAQLAGLIRLEDLYHSGGCYIDSDVELYRPLDPLLGLGCFAAWEDADVVPDAVLGAEAGHPAIAACIDLALDRLRSNSPDWRTGPGAWGTGPGVTTTILPGRDDVTLLGTEAFFPYHYSELHRRTDDHAANPATYGAHHWHGSWVKEAL